MFKIQNKIQCCPRCCPRTSEYDRESNPLSSPHPCEPASCCREVVLFSLFQVERTMLPALIALAVAWLSWFVFDVYTKGKRLSSIPRVPRRTGLLGVVLGNLQDLTNKRYHRTSCYWTQRCGEVARLRVLWNQVRAQLSVVRCAAEPVSK